LAKNVIMPALGMAQETGRVIQWLKQEGDTVKKDEPILEIETDKATVEIESPADGVLMHIVAEAGQDVPVGETIAVVVAPGETPPPLPSSHTDTHVDSQTIPAVTVTASQAQSVQDPDETQSSEVVITASPLARRIAAEHGIDLAKIKPRGGHINKNDVLAFLETRETVAVRIPTTNGSNGSRVLASPKARRIAREEGINLAQVPGSGPDGAVLAADVLHYAEHATLILPTTDVPDMRRTIQTPLPPQGEVLTISNVWRVMAERTTASWTSVPHFYLLREVNASRLIEWRERVKDSGEVKITYTDMLVKLVALTLRNHPRVNASWVDGNIRFNPSINIGIAVASEDGLLVPVIHDADTNGLHAIAARRKAIVERAQSGKVSITDVQGGTFTISNLGMYGIDAFNAIVNPPQAAILAVGRIVERVVPVNGQPAVQPMLVLSASFDHRVVDGARGAEFLQDLAETIEDPLRALN